MVDMKLEVVVVPVSDVDRAKEFYQKMGGGTWRNSDVHASPNGLIGQRVKRRPQPALSGPAECQGLVARTNALTRRPFAAVSSANPAWADASPQHSLAERFCASYTLVTSRPMR